MSNSPDTGLDLEDLELQLLPAWARQSPSANRYAKYEGGERPSGTRGRDGGERRGRGPEDRRFGGDMRSSDPRRPRGDRSRPPHREGVSRADGPRREDKLEAAPALPDVSVTIVPEEKGVESLARQIKLTGRAYPIFDIAHLILKRPDRYRVAFGVVKKPDGQVPQRLWSCNLDDTIWLSEPDAVHHALHRHFDTFYKAGRTPTDPPKGTYTFVAQCSLSGVILGPPNYHDYQNKLRKLHSERFARMPFEAYKSKVRIVKDEAVVKKWIEEQSFKTEYSCLNVPEAKNLGSREEVEKHFREVHLANIIAAVEAHTLPGPAAQQLPAPALRQLLRRAWDEQQRFPLKVVTTLSQQLAAHGLQFFKVNKTITHVAVARPHFLDLDATPVSEGIKRIVDRINARPGCTRRQLIESLSPSPPPAATAVADADGTPSADRPAVASTAPQAALQEPTPEQTAVIADLHWLIHQGHVIEFANGRIETAKKPIPKPPRPEARPLTVAAGPATPGVAQTKDAPATADVESSSQTEAASESVSGTLETPQRPEEQSEVVKSAAVDSDAETAVPPSEIAMQNDPATAQTGGV
jgi:hypothetical protein